MGNQFSNEDALRSDLPGLSIRIPGTDSQVRLYGFAKLSAWTDLNGRNQTDAPTAQTIPLNNSAADMQGGDFGMTARFSRIGVDTRTLTSWGTLETRIEGDFGGGSPTSSNAVFRLRQAWAELGDENFRVLVRSGEQPLERRYIRDDHRRDQPQSIIHPPGADPRRPGSLRPD